MDKEELKRQCESLSNQELLAIVNNKMGYTVEIVTAVQIELRNRAIPKEEVKMHKKQLAQQAKIITGNIVDDLSLADKVLFYVFFFPQLNYFVRRSYRKQGYILKLRQGGYYSFLGFVFFIPVFVSGLDRFSPLNCFIIWALCFLPAYAFDLYFYKEQTIRRLRKRTGNPEEKSQE